MSNRSSLSFTSFLLNENKVYLGSRIGDILAAIQDLTQNSEGMGTRQLVANSQRILSQIRRILHSNWSKREEKYLKQLQKSGVAIAKAIEEKDDLSEVLTAVTSELETLLSKMGTPLHDLGAEESPEKGDDSQVADTQGKQPQQPQQKQPQPPQPQQPPTGLPPM